MTDMFVDMDIILDNCRRLGIEVKREPGGILFNGEPLNAEKEILNALHSEDNYDYRVFCHYETSKNSTTDKGTAYHSSDDLLYAS